MFATPPRTPTAKTPLATLLVGVACVAHAASDGELTLNVVDPASGAAVPARIQLQRVDGKRVPSRGWGQATLGREAYLDGSVTLGLRRGAYRFDLDAGPEYRTQSGHFEIDRDAQDSKRIEVNRFANLADEGWRAADLQTSRPARDYPLLLRAAQTTLAPRVGYEWKSGEWKPIGKPSDRGDAAGASALWQDARGVVWFVDPLGELGADALPAPGDSSVRFLSTARERGWRVVVSLSSWELPLWLAHNVVDAVVLIDGWADSSAGARATKLGNPGDHKRFGGPQGAGRWREHVYHQMLEAGLRVPPVAGSGSGLNKRPMSEARVYAHTASSRDANAWWPALAEGAVVVTNGPLLRPLVGGSPPGETFALVGEEPLELFLALNLATRGRVEYLEVIRNGKPALAVRLSDWASSGGKLPPIPFTESGWMLVRAVTANDNRYQLATSAPYFVQSPKGPRITRAAAEFFQTWLHEAWDRVGVSGQRDYDQADAFWLERIDAANAD